VYVARWALIYFTYHWLQELKKDTLVLQLEREKERRAADEDRQAERARVRAMVSREQQEFSQMEKVRLVLSVAVLMFPNKDASKLKRKQERAEQGEQKKRR
jgi:hypothetical protein